MDPNFRDVLKKNEKYRKIKELLYMPILKVEIVVAPLFFMNSYSLVPKVEICLFSDKNPKKAAIVN